MSIGPALLIWFKLENLYTMVNVCVQEITEDEHEEEVKQPICHSQSSVHSSRGHTPFDFMFGRERRIFLDVMIGLKGMRLTSDVRQSLLRSSESAERCI